MIRDVVVGEPHGCECGGLFAKAVYQFRTEFDVPRIMRWGHAESSTGIEEHAALIMTTKAASKVKRNKM